MKKVLVIEDTLANLKLIKYPLERCGYEVIHVSDGLAGVEMAKELKPFFIIMDIHLPTIDGIEATMRIRSAKEGKNIPIIAITSNAMVGDKEKAIQAGCNGYFIKPIDPITIMDDIHKLLGINQ